MQVRMKHVLAAGTSVGGRQEYPYSAAPPIAHIVPVRSVTSLSDMSDLPIRYAWSCERKRGDMQVVGGAAYRYVVASQAEEGCLLHTPAMMIWQPSLVPL